MIELHDKLGNLISVGDRLKIDGSKIIRIASAWAAGEDRGKLMIRDGLIGARNVEAQFYGGKSYRFVEPSKCEVLKCECEEIRSISVGFQPASECFGCYLED
jgi:hypothetical protein